MSKSLRSFWEMRGLSRSRLEKPRIAFKGVRKLMAHVGEEDGLGLIACSAVFLASSAAFFNAPPHLLRRGVHGFAAPPEPRAALSEAADSSHEIGRRTRRSHDDQQGGKASKPPRRPPGRKSRYSEINPFAVPDSIIVGPLHLESVFPAGRFVYVARASRAIDLVPLCLQSFQLVPVAIPLWRNIAERRELQRENALVMVQSERARGPDRLL